MRVARAAGFRAMRVVTACSPSAVRRRACKCVRRGAHAAAPDALTTSTVTAA
ncbi:hypothetical protein BDSB_17710 [Burkholderia dolosa PC543]|nr:hypothetical protein BDSB_17710 [Burkholderia dolosa PC543]